MMELKESVYYHIPPSLGRLNSLFVSYYTMLSIETSFNLTIGLPDKYQLPIVKDSLSSKPWPPFPPLRTPIRNLRLGPTDSVWSWKIPIRAQTMMGGLSWTGKLHRIIQRIVAPVALSKETNDTLSMLS